MRTALTCLVALMTLAGGQAQPPGFDPNSFAESIFKRADKNGDGNITRDEAKGERLEKSFDEVDGNKDGSITLDEFKPYMTARFGGSRGRSGYTPPVPGATPDSPTPTTTIVMSSSTTSSSPAASVRPVTPPSGKPAEDDKKPFVARYGNLPKEAPKWFNDLDQDQDAMIGLYEWRRDKRPIAEFVVTDLNGDGYLTIDEYLRHEKAKIDAKPDDKQTAVARLRGEPIERVERVEVKSERTESASTGERKRGQRRDSKANPFDNR